MHITIAYCNYNVPTVSGQAATGGESLQVALSLKYNSLECYIARTTATVGWGHRRQWFEAPDSTNAIHLGG